ncbi:hypothetical protein [Pantoea sp. B65]|uniref:hypothetical protein n=1 Tax=Pantoea sp. B65 TaxID=2813359 RepID=UPI0039B52E4F
MPNNKLVPVSQSSHATPIPPPASSSASGLSANLRQTANTPQQSAAGIILRAPPLPPLHQPEAPLTRGFTAAPTFSRGALSSSAPPPSALPGAAPSALAPEPGIASGRSLIRPVKKMSLKESAQRAAQGSSSAGEMVALMIKHQKIARQPDADSAQQADNTASAAVYAPPGKHVKTWHEMSQQERDACGGAAGYGKTHNLNPASWLNMANDKGLKQRGKDRLTHGQLRSNTDYVFHLNKWENMTDEQRADPRAYADKYNIYFPVWSVLVDQKGLTTKGKDRQFEAQIAADKTPPDYTFHLNAWCELADEERKKPDAARLYARANRLHITWWRRLVDADGLTSRGKAKLAPTLSADKVDWGYHCQHWQNKTQRRPAAPGEAEKYGRQQNLPLSVWLAYAGDNGLSKTGQAKLAFANNIQPVDYKFHCQEWLRILAEEPDKYPAAMDYAIEKGLDPGNWTRLVTGKGLRAPGKRLIQPREDTVKVNWVKECLQWQQLTEQQGGAGCSAEEYAVEKKFSVVQWAKYASNHGLTPGGKEKVRQAQENLTRDLVEYCKKWQAMTREERGKIGRGEYARVNKLDPIRWRKLVDLDGLTPYGEQEVNPPTTMELTPYLQEWQRISREKPQTRQEAIQYAVKNGILISRWLKFVNTATFSSSNLQQLPRLHATEQRLSYPAIISEWLKLPAKHRQTKGAMTTFARQHDLKPGNFSYFLRKYSQQNPTADDSPSPPPSPSSSVPQIKTEPPSPSGGGVEVITFDKDDHVISSRLPEPRLLEVMPDDDNGPILNTADGSPSDIIQKLGPSETWRVNHWGEMNHVFTGMRSKEAKQLKAQLREQFRQIVATNIALPSYRPGYLAIHGSHHQVDEEIIPLGNGLFNSSNEVVEKFTVLGAYSGAWHIDGSASGVPGTLSQERRKYGTRAVLTYIFGTGAGTRVVSAVSQGNRLRKMNTGQLPGKEKISDNNVACVLYASNIHFYVTTRPVMPGEEYFISYGERYNPNFAIEVAREQEAAETRQHIKRMMQDSNISRDEALTRIKTEQQELTTTDTPLRPEVSFTAADIRNIADTLLRTAKAWRSELGDMAPLILARAEGMPQNMVLTIHRGAVTHVYPWRQDGYILHGDRFQPLPHQLHVPLFLSGEEGATHYNAVDRHGGLIANPADGDCLFRAIGQGLREYGNLDYSIAHLRHIAADTFIANNDRYLVNVDLDQLIADVEQEKTRQRSLRKRTAARME